MGTRAAPLRIPKPTLRRSGGAWRLEATVDGAPLWFECSDADLAPRAEAFACALLVPALAEGRRLVVEGEVDPRFAANVPSLLGVLREWWGGDGRVEFERVAAMGTPPVAATGLAFSAGADSFHALRRDAERPDVLVHVHGFDVRLRDPGRAAAAERTVREVAAAVGARAVVVRTNVREHPRFRATSWERTHGGALMAAGHALSTAVGRLLVAASWHSGLTCPYGTHPRTDPLWGATHVAFACVGRALSRFDKLREMLDDPLVRRHLRVCWVQGSHEGNCGVCEKCLRTRLVLEQGGVASAFPSLPSTEPIEVGLDRLQRMSSWVHGTHVGVELGRGLPAPAAAAARRLLERSRPRGAPARVDHAWTAAPAPPGRAPRLDGAWRLGTPRVEAAAGGGRVVADVAGAPLWFASRDVDLLPRAEALASALLVPALVHGVRLDVEAEVDPTFATRARSLDEILRSWWGYAGPAAALRPAAQAAIPHRPATAFAFGGGVTSFDALRRGLVRPDLLVLALGLDVPLEDAPRAEAAERGARAAAAAVGARAVVVRTNLRTHPAFAGVPSVPAQGGVLAALGHLLAGVASTLVVGAPQHAHYAAPHGIHPRTLPLSGSSALDLRLVGDDLWRGEKVAGLASDATARTHLRVCREGRGGAANCSRCEACLSTMVGLEAAGALSRFEAFDASEPLAARLDRLPSVDGEWALGLEADLGRGLPVDTAAAVRALLGRSAPPRRPALARLLRRVRRHVRRGVGR